jgi:hypothetical protein
MTSTGSDAPPALRFDGWLIAVADPADTDEYHAKERAPRGKLTAR